MKEKKTYSANTFRPDEIKSLINTLTGNGTRVTWGFNPTSNEYELEIDKPERINRVYLSEKLDTPEFRQTMSNSLGVKLQSDHGVLYEIR